MVVVDTSILIDHLRMKIGSGESMLEKFVKKHQVSQLAISLTTIQELYQGKSSRMPEKEIIIVTLLSQFKHLPITYEIAKLAGTLTRDSNQVLKFADATIAATALYHHVDLLTLNVKDFENIPEISLRSLS